ncbi:MAG: ABC transporter ATP-binding protein/permease [Propionibacteriaceae bacterium]|nr:ABC transporter ATP-binding protein/permease [Propionibacteriaceae bacterium]
MHRSYGDSGVPALDSVSLTVSAGEFLAVIGPSGSGKSTLLNILGLLDRPDAGEYRIGEVSAGTLSERAKDALREQTFGFVFQSAHVLPERTVAENVALPLSVRGTAADVIAEHVADSLSQVGLGDMAQAKASTLSGGERQRVAIARALVTRPTVILADEPTGSLDSANSRQVLDLLADAKAEGATVVVVTHDPEVAACADRIVEVRDGRIVADTGRRLPAESDAISAKTTTTAPTGRWSEAGRRVGFTIIDAVGSLMARPVRTLLILTSFLLGAGGIVAAQAISQTAANQVQDQLTAAALDQLYVIPAARSGPDDLRDLAAQIAHVSHVREVGLRVDVSPSDARASLLPPGRLEITRLDAATIIAADSRYLRIVSPDGVPQSAWLLDEPAHGDVALIGISLAERLGVRAPGPGRVVWAWGRPHDVVGVLTDEDLASTLVLSDPYTLAAHAAGVDAALVVRTVPGYPARVSDFLKRILPPSAQVTTTADLESLRLGVREDLSALVTAVSAIVLVLASLSAASALTLSVQARTGEIALRRAIGTPRRKIARMFLLEGGLLGLLGGLFGSGLGVCAAILIAQIRDWAPYFEPPIWLFGVLVGTATGLIAAVIPASRAASLDPAQGLRHE